jgi:hypothetical protein
MLSPLYVVSIHHVIVNIAICTGDYSICYKRTPNACRLFQAVSSSSTVLRFHVDNLCVFNKIFIPNTTAFGNNSERICGRIVVHDRKRIEKEVLPRYFNHSSFASLRRQLNYFAFVRLGRGRQKGATYFNENVMVLEDILHLKRVVPEVMFCEGAKGKPVDSPCCSIKDHSASLVEYHGTSIYSSVLSESAQASKIGCIKKNKNTIVENICGLTKRGRISYQPAVVTVSPPEYGDEGNASFTTTIAKECFHACNNTYTSENFAELHDPIRHTSLFSYDGSNLYSLQNEELIVCAALVNMHGLKNI